MDQRSFPEPRHRSGIKYWCPSILYRREDNFSSDFFPCAFWHSVTEKILASKVSAKEKRARPREAALAVCHVLKTLGLDENDHQCKQHQRFNQRQTQDHHGLNFRGGAWIARCAFTSRGANP